MHITLLLKSGTEVQLQLWHLMKCAQFYDGDQHHYTRCRYGVSYSGRAMERICHMKSNVLPVDMWYKEDHAGSCIRYNRENGIRKTKFL